MTVTAIQKTMRGLIAVGAVFLLSLAAMGYTSVRLSESKFWTLHTHQVIEELKDSLTALLDVETGDRGYLITGDEKFLDVYKLGKARAPVVLQEVKELTTDNPEQQERVNLLVKLADEKIKFAEGTINSGPEGGSKMISSGRGREIMDAYRSQVDEMILAEQLLLKRRTQDLESTQMTFLVAAGALTLFSGGLLGWIYRITKTALETERKRIDELNEMNNGLTYEIEKRKRIERALKDTTLKLTSSNTDLQRFAYVASHDLQEPLRAVAGFLTLIAKKHKGTLDEESEEWISHAVEGAQRMRTLINDLLAYARVESRGGQLKEIETKTALEQAQKDLRVAIEESDAEIVTGDLPVVFGDSSQLTQVFQNLIGNAIKFKGDSNPHIEIDAKLVNEEWLFTVRDRGIGFEPEHADRIFIIFQRLHGREEYKGTGIGLALCKKIIERHGGRIWAESEIGKGATFSFTLPLQRGELDVRSQND